jgi:hypothetical protein
MAWMPAYIVVRNPYHIDGHNWEAVHIIIECGNHGKNVIVMIYRDGTLVMLGAVLKPHVISSMVLFW